MLTELQSFKRWLCWEVTSNGDSWDKIPVNPETGRPASSNDPSSWTTYEVAKAAVDAGKYQSIGFALGDEVGLSIVDFDKVRATPFDSFPAWVQNELEELDSYTEVSVSGCGLHVLVWGSVPANLNRQKLHVEVWSKNKMFSLTGDIFEGRDEIKARDLSSLHGRILTERIGPDHKPTLVVERYDTNRYRSIANDEWFSQGLTSRSDAVASALCTLAVKHNFDRSAIREDFEATPLCHAWEEKGKWTRLGESEISKAIEFMSRRVAPSSQVLDFALPPVLGSDFDYVLNPLDGFVDGWIPRGEISLVAGSSGSGKTTLAVDLLIRQARGEEIFGHTTNSLPYLVLLEDRSERALRRTLARMRVDATKLAYKPLQLEGRTVAQAVAQCVETSTPMPAVLFLEGLDLLAQDASAMRDVSEMLKDLMRVAVHYHLAILGSMGQPKMKVKDRYLALRDQVFGSVAFPRKAETILSLQKDGGTEVSPITFLTVMLRNAPCEEFRLQFEDGRLVPAPPAIEGGTETGKPGMTEAEAWAKTQLEPFEILDLRQRFPLLTEKEAKKMLDDLLVYKVVRRVTNGRVKTYVAETQEVFA